MVLWKHTYPLEDCDAVVSGAGGDHPYEDCGFDILFIKMKVLS